MYAKWAETENNICLVVSMSHSKMSVLLGQGQASDSQKGCFLLFPDFWLVRLRIWQIQLMGSFRLAQNSRCLKLSSDGVTQKSGKMVSCQDPRHDVFHRVTESHETSATNGISRHFQETLTIGLTLALALIEFTCESVEDHTHRLDYTPRHTEIRRTKTHITDR